MKHTTFASIMYQCSKTKMFCSEQYQSNYSKRRFTHETYILAGNLTATEDLAGDLVANFYSLVAKSNDNYSKKNPTMQNLFYCSKTDFAENSPEKSPKPKKVVL
jgi:hypothetical protein